ALPVAAAALTGQRGIALAAGTVFLLGSALEMLLGGAASLTVGAVALPALACCVAFAGVAMVSRVGGLLREEAEHLERQNTRYVRAMYQREREDGQDGSADKPRPQDRSAAHDDIGKVDYAMLLLTLQEIGRRI